MRTIVAAGAAEAEQTLPETAAKWILKTEALWLALLVAAILTAMTAHAASARPQPGGCHPFRGVLWSAVALYVTARLMGVPAGRAAQSAVLFAVVTAAQILDGDAAAPRGTPFPTIPNSMVWRTL